MANSIGSEGTVLNPASTSQPDGTLISPSLGRQGEALNSDLHGKFYTSAYRKNVFSFNVTAVTVPVVASGLVSVFSLWNPPNSNVVAEIIDAEIGQVLAATVVDVAGWYMSTGNLALAGTFTTKAVGNTAYFSGRVGDLPAGAVIPYSAYTHSGTPARVDMIASFGATTDAGIWQISKFYDGRLILPPGSVISVAMSTAAGTTSGLDLGVRWSEWPV